jgi:AraC-like DNA-binding protein
MQPVPRPILVLSDETAFVARLREVARDPAQVRPAADWEALEKAMQRASPSAVTFADPYFGEAAGPSPRLRQLLRDLPSATVVAVFRITGERAGDLRELLQWGIAEVVDLGREDTSAGLARRLELVQRRAVDRVLERALPRATPSRTRGLLAVAAEVVAAGGDGGDLAAALGVTERSVLRWCARADLPQPRRLLAWLRVLLAADLLDDPGRSLASVARACGYSADAALRNTFRAFLGRTPGDLRAAGAFEAAASAFAKELFELRERSHARGKPEKIWLH